MTACAALVEKELALAHQLEVKAVKEKIAAEVTCLPECARTSCPHWVTSPPQVRLLPGLSDTRESESEDDDDNDGDDNDDDGDNQSDHGPPILPGQFPFPVG